MSNFGFSINSKSKLIYIIAATLLVILSVVGAVLIGIYGYKVGVLPLLIGVGALFVYAVLRMPRFGVMALLVLSYFIMFFINTGLIEFPLGLLMDGMLALLAVGFFIQQKYYKNFKIFNNPVSYLILIWISYNLIQVFNPNAASQLAWIYTIRSVAFVMISYYIFTYYIISVKFIRSIIILWLCLGVFAALYAMKQEYFGFFPFEEWNHFDPLIQSLLFIDGHWRKNSIFSDPVAFSFNMAICSILCIALITGPYKMRSKILLGCLATLFAFVMTYSGTRAAYVLIPAALLLFVIMKLDRYILGLAVVGTLGLLILINIPTTNVTLYRFQSTFKPNSDPSYNVRKANQQKIQPFIQSHPIGGGLGGSGVWGVRFAPGSILAKFPPDSGYIRVAMELGWVGLFIICSIMFAGLYFGIKHYFSIRDPELKTYCFAMTLIIFAITIANFPQEAIVQYPLSIFFYLFLALVKVTKVLDDKKYAEDNNIQEKKIKYV
ncbi:MAG: O-antigen ligase family protein [Bacteroidetes bacterium]|nr:O-antigen ligase family protein [Bacteroidota bacterium]MBU1484054.1 O-antigen ligase family protein [Bacteroidota bacterium]MBU2046872.1 O-antigen ligase family protein [Bacteroidota bacterium]MBU2269631.1 O-antigen ligase family protein [Bacteroidota bacterium]MBU2377459.1 O-antigen ligase family protein [Bacteroidota bacterium]